MEFVQGVPSNAHEPTDLCLDGNLSADGSGPLSRSSVTHVAYIVSKFDDVKRDLVREIGFHGILDLPQISKIDRKFTLWLLTRLDVEKKCIIVNDQIVTDIIDFEVARILGIPCGRRQVCALDCGDKKSKIDFIQHSIGSRKIDTNGLVAAERNVTAAYFLPMSKEDVDNFKVSFVVWVMGHLLAPTKKHNIGSDRFWGALMVPDDIKYFNWAAYVMEELFIAARDVQHTIKQKKPITTITGCSILLQILYFDSVRMGSLSRPRGILPRVKAYDSKSLSLMITADKASSSSGSENPTWGSTVRVVPPEFNANFHPDSHTSNGVSDNANVVENEVISDFSAFVRNKFGDKVSPHQAVALSWFHARCTQHVKKLRLRLQEDTTALVAKLFCTPPSSIGSVPRQPVLNGKIDVRQAQSEPMRTLSYGSTVQTIKRAAEGPAGCAKHRGTKKAHMSFPKYTLPETILTGIDVSAEHVVDDQISDSEHHFNSVLHKTGDDVRSSGCDIGIPSFDLGIDLETQTQKPSAGTLSGRGNICEEIPVRHKTSNSIHTANGVDCNDAFVDSSVGSQSPDPCADPNVSLGLNIVPTESKRSSDHGVVDLGSSGNRCTITPILKSDLSLSMPLSASQNVVSLGNEPSDWLSTPIRIFNVLSCTQPSVKCSDANLFVTPDQRIQSSTTSPALLTKIMAEGDLVDRISQSEDSPNLNIAPWDNDYSNSPIKRRTVRSHKLVESLWTSNLSHRNPPRDIVDKFFEDVSELTSSSLNRTWLAHNSPRQIEVDGEWIYQVFIMQKPMSYDICDLTLRRLKQLDDMMYSDPSEGRWRHVLESELAMLSLAGECAYNRKSIVEQFIGSCAPYPVENCRMIVVPAYVLLNWSCYFFDFRDKCVHVIDPLFNKAQAKLFMQLHQENVTKVAAAVANCIEKYFENWNHNMHEWDVKFVQPTVVDATSAETGLLTLLYIRQFDGSKIYNATRETFLDFNKVMLYELMCLKENYVKAPVNLTIAIDD